MKNVVLLALVLTIIRNCFGQRVSKCKEKLDIALVIQIPNENTANAIPTFIKNVKSRLVERNPCVRMATVLANEAPAQLIKLSCGYSSRGRCYKLGMQKLTTELQNRRIPLPRQSALGKAMDLLPDVVFNTKNGARRDAKRIAILLLTSSPDNSTMSPADAVRDLHDYGIRVYAVSVGAGKAHNLRKITLSKEGMMKVASMSRLSLRSIAETFTLLAKGELPPLPAAALEFSSAQPNFPLLKSSDLEEQCRYLADVGFLVDSSGSVRDDYDKETYFVRRIAAKFNVSEEGSRGSVILFSSKGYVTLSIRFNQYKRLQDFNSAVQLLPFYGYETRIDLALKTANQSMFNTVNGMRPNINNVLILITDGRQRPSVDRDTGEVLNPAATAEVLHQRNMIVFAIGVGKRINGTELEKITKDKNRVLLVDDYTELISDAVVKKVSKKLCSERGKLVTPTTETKTGPGPTPTPSQPCTKSSCSGCCCGTGPIYINVFNGNQNTVLQGLSITNSDSGTVPVYNGVPMPGPNGTNIKSQTFDRLLALVKTLIPNKEVLNKVVSGLDFQTTRTPPGTQDPGIVINRKKEILISNWVEDTQEESATFIEVNPVFAAMSSGWYRFSNSLKQDLTSMLIKYKDMANVTILVPSPHGRAVDHKFEEKMRSEGLENYMLLPVDNLWSYLRPVRGNEVLRSYIDVSEEGEKGTLTIENSKVLGTPVKASGVTVLSISNTLQLPKKNVLLVMKQNPKLSIFTEWIKLSGILAFMENPSVPSKFCLDEKVCLDLDQNMKKRLDTIASLKQYTIFAPSNAAILKLPKSKIQDILGNKEALRKVIASHIVFGTIFSRSVNSEIRHISPSLSQNNIVYMLSKQSGKLPLQYSDLLQTKQANVLEADIRATDAILHTVDTIFTE